ncbi:MAG: cell envelope biogenesis protein OmpA [Bacteroidetes bacterium]|nr:MAG: cell envelope biogenesis protein OmpA [Bacteroidota bacterium]
MKTKLKYTILLLLMGTVVSFAQGRKLKKAVASFNNYSYIDATTIYLKVAESGFTSKEISRNLGDAYYFNANYTEAAKWYQDLFIQTDSVRNIYYLRYSQSLKAVGLDEESVLWFDKYAIKAELKGQDFENAEDYLQIIDESSNRYKIHPVTINTDGIDFGAAFKNKETYTYTKIVFASTGATPSKTNRKKLDPWTELNYLDLYEVTMDEEGMLGQPVKLEGDVNSEHHETSAVFTKDGKTMYFTRNNSSPRAKRGKAETEYLKIYRAHLVNGEWIDIEDLSINGDNYSTAHPALNAEEDKLYFVSDMPQTLGESDIFMATINKDGSLGKPINLGKKVNTKGRESFPFISKDNELYFSSEGHYGLGGYDVFYVQLKGSGYTGGLYNIGKPINSAYDDFAFVIHNHKGFVSSNREEGQGYDDVYGFVETKDIKEITMSTVFGKVSDKDTQQPLANATISILDSNTKLVTTVITDGNGNYTTVVDRSKGYIIKATKQEYAGDDVLSEKNLKEREYNFELERNVFEVAAGDDIAKILEIIIYFDLDKAAIRPDAQVELQKIIAVLQENPQLKINVKSHTDSRANDAYNMSLSNRRNTATINYIVSKGGIDANRLSGKGYGET